MASRVNCMPEGRRRGRRRAQDSAVRRLPPGHHDNEAPHKRPAPPHPTGAGCHRGLLEQAQKGRQRRRQARPGHVVDQAEKQKLSIHAKPNADDPKRLNAACADCHDSHTFAKLEPGTPAMAAARLAMPTRCGGCHDRLSSTNTAARPTARRCSTRPTRRAPSAPTAQPARHRPHEQRRRQAGHREGLRRLPQGERRIVCRHLPRAGRRARLRQYRQVRQLPRQPRYPRPEGPEIQGPRRQPP